jgi:2-oxoisovalerate dehydrogenase E1 component
MALEKLTKEKQNELFIKEVLNDFKLACISREASLLGRKEVLTGKAKFGIFGDGKELAQIAMAKQFQDGDFRSGYYRDQTFMFAIGALSVQQWFAGLYANTDVEQEPTSAGRQMGGHFATRNLEADGTWKDLTKQKNSSADISPTAGQMPRLVGLANASKIFRNNKELKKFTKFSNNGNEVAFGTIGDASTSEGLFFESINAAGVLQIPIVMSVWDDGYGISVPKLIQTTKGSISEILKGFEKNEDSNGWKILKVKGWDYAGLIKTYEQATDIAREGHIPVLVHVEEVTQPQGHSTSGSHERYKSKEILEWTKEYDCIEKFKQFILNFKIKISTPEELEQIQTDAKKEVQAAQKLAWNSYLLPIKNEVNEAIDLLLQIADKSNLKTEIENFVSEIKSIKEPVRKDLLSAARKVLVLTRGENIYEKQYLKDWLSESKIANFDRYSSYLHSSSSQSAMKVKEIKPIYDATENLQDGRIVLRDNYDVLFQNNPLLLLFGEDVGKIGGVNQTMEGMQQKYGELRVTDTGIREATIIGQGIGMAMRGLRPIAEIQYLDYLLYALQIMSDDLATLHYRTKGGQKAPLIISTRGHRLEGIWHSGSPMGTIINAIRGIYVCVPRNLTQAAGFYNGLLKSDDPALVIEPLNGYRNKENMPLNLGEFTIPLGIPEIVSEGSDVTIVSYGSTFNLAILAAKRLDEVGISAEMIDVRTLLPFDINHLIAESIKKTSRLLIVDEDVPGGASAFILDKILNEQDCWKFLDNAPKTLSAQEHRPAYGTDGDYFSKPSIEDIFEAAYGLMNESDPYEFPKIN